MIKKKDTNKWAVIKKKDTYTVLGIYRQPKVPISGVPTNLRSLSPKKLVLVTLLVSGQKYRGG